MDSTKPRAAYRPDIDGLRAVAVLAVIFYHAGFTTFFGGGYVGVDIFFVISGFLITGIVHREYKSGSFRFRSFYERRIRRIVPAFFFMSLVCTIVAFFLLSPSAFKIYGITLMRASTCVANFYFMSHTGGYFDAPSHNHPLLHTWSLSVEEQFYFVFPLVFILALKFARKYIIALTAGTLVISLAASIFVVTLNQPYAFYMLPTRAWELLCGALLALYPLPDFTPRKRNLIMTLGLGCILAAVIGYGRFPSLLFPGLAAIPPCLGAMLCILGGGHNQERSGAVNRLLSCRPVVFLGLVSYSLYLWHWPIFTFYRLTVLKMALPFKVAVGLIALSLMMSIFSWALVEQPFRKKQLLKNQLPLIVTGLLALGILALTGYSIFKKHIPSFIKETSYAAGEFDREQSYSTPESLKEVIKPFHFFGDIEKTPTIMVIGDSHATSIASTLDRIGKYQGQSGIFIAHNPPFFNCVLKKPRDMFDQSVKDVAGVFPPETVLLVARYALYTNGFLDNEGVKDRAESNISYISDKSSEISLISPKGEGSLSPVESLYYGIREMIEYFKKQGTSHFYILLPIPEHGYNVPEEANRLSFLKMDVDTVTAVPLQEYLERQADVLPVLHALEAEYNGYVRLLDPVTLLCADGKLCAGTRNGLTLYFDDDHLNNTGAMELKNLFMPVFERSLLLRPCTEDPGSQPPSVPLP